MPRDGIQFGKVRPGVLPAVIALISALPLFVRAQGTGMGEAKGRVVFGHVDTTGQPKEDSPADGIQVFLVCCDRDDNAITKSGGHFWFRLPAGKTWQCAVDAPGGYAAYYGPDQHTCKMPIVGDSIQPVIPEKIVLLPGGPRPSPRPKKGLRQAVTWIPLLGLLPASFRQGAPPLWQQQSRKCPAVLSSRVADENGRGLVGAVITVRVRDPQGGPAPTLKVLEAARSGEKGKFGLEAPGLADVESFHLSIGLEGYEAQIAWIDCSKPLPVNFTLRPVRGTDIRVETIESARRTAFSPRLIEVLPLPGIRTVDSLALLSPGVLPAPATGSPSGPGLGSGIGTAGQFSVNGLRSRENNFTVDGSDNNDEDVGVRRQGFVSPLSQSIESIQEFQIITALADTRFGRNIAGQVNALSKSGGPVFHGSVYGFLTDRRLNARNFFDSGGSDGPARIPLRAAGNGLPVLLDGQPLLVDNPGYREAPFTRTQAGFVVGGPLKWPAKMPRAFIFASYERQDAHSSLMSHFAVPTVAQRGVFETGETGFRRLRLESIPLFPASVPGNAIFSLFPFPNNPAGPYGANTHTRLLPADGKGTLFSTKLERHFDARGWRNTAIGRYNISDERSVLPVSGGALYSSLSPKLRIQNLAFYVHSQISERTAQTVRLSYGRSSSHFDPVPHYDLTGSSLLAEMPFLLNRPLLLNMTAPNPDGSGKPPSYVSASSPDGAALLRAHGYRSVTHTEQITGPLGRVEIAGFSPLGVDVFSFPQARANNTFQWADTLITLRGPHRLALGFDIRRTQINSFMDRNYRPVLVFHGLRNPVGGVGVPLIGSDGSFLPQEVLTGATLAAAGVPTGLFHTLAANPDSNLGLRFTHFNFFFQDEWRATSNFHLTLGARYQFNTVPGTVGRRLEDAFDRASLERQAEETKTQCPVRCGDLVQGLSVFPKDFGATFGADPNDVAPRVGLVWNLGGAGNTVLRGGFGLYTSVSPGIAMNHSRSAFPLFIPLNLANFAPLAQNRSFLFNLANPSVRELGPELDLVAPNTLNQLTVNNPISLLALNLYSLRGSLSPTYPSLNVVVPSGNLRNPVSYQYAIALEHDFRRWFAGSLSYVGTRGLRLFRVATPDLGVNRSFVQLASDVRPLCFACREFSGGVGGEFPFFAGLMRPPQSDPIARSFTLARTVFESSGSSTYNSLQLEGRCRYNRHYQFGVALTYSHVIDDVSDFFDTAGAFPLPQNSRRRSERASANFDSRLRGVVSFLWDLPPSGTSRWLGGWQLAGIFVSQTGQPFTVNSALDVNRDGNLTDRLHLTDKLILGPLQADPRTRLLLAPGANTLELIAPDGMDGAVGRNAFRAPGLATLDLALTKTFELTARHRIRFRTEAFNFFNRSHFGIPVRILEAPGFGQSVNTAVPARMLQFAVKYLF